MKRVLVMFKCHFDAGFVDTQATVVHKYFRDYFPQAIEIARAANAGGKRRYVWTTGSWLLLRIPGAGFAGRAQSDGRGHCARRHRLACPALYLADRNTQPAADRRRLAISKSLDRRFGVVTTGAKMTDVPGHTRGMVPPLAAWGRLSRYRRQWRRRVSGVAADFLWQDPSGASLPVMYHRDYGGSVRARLRSGGCLVVRTDNSGPHTAEEIAKVHADYAARFPNAEITACNLSDIAKAIQPYRDKLPVVTEEMGDTWIYGLRQRSAEGGPIPRSGRLRESGSPRGGFDGDATNLSCCATPARC